MKNDKRSGDVDAVSDRWNRSPVLQNDRMKNARPRSANGAQYILFIDFLNHAKPINEATDSEFKYSLPKSYL
jgi:hypothetical protein